MMTIVFHCGSGREKVRRPQATRKPAVEMNAISVTYRIFDPAPADEIEGANGC